MPGSARRLVRPLRATAAAAAAAALLTAAAAGCANFDAALGRQWAVVHFRPSTPVATVLKVRALCSHVPHARPMPLPRSRSGPGMLYSVRFRTDDASDADLARLQQCLQRFPSVTGIEFQDVGDG